MEIVVDGPGLFQNDANNHNHEENLDKENTSPLKIISTKVATRSKFQCHVLLKSIQVMEI